jgi:hypothetical protein
MAKKSKEELFLADADKWDYGELGRDDAHVKVSGVKQTEIDDVLGLQVISIRLPKHYTAI